MNIPRQNTEEWRRWRKMKVGASDAPIILGKSPWTSVGQLWRRKLDLESEQPMTAKMQRGVDLEPEALAAFNEYTKAAYEPLVMIHKRFDWCIASLDGWDADLRQGLEIKCPGESALRSAEKGQIPSYYIPQLQHQMAVAELDHIHYWSYDGKKGTHLICKRDEAFIKHLLEQEAWFYDCLINIVEPTLKYETEKGAPF